MMSHLFFSAGTMQCALPLENVSLVLQMVQPGPARQEDRGAAGTINLHGRIIPLYSVRSFFGIPDCAPRLTDKIIVTQAGPETAALWVDETHVVRQSPAAAAPEETIGKGREVVPGVEQTRQGLFLFTDLRLFLESGSMIPPALPGEQER